MSRYKNKTEFFSVYNAICDINSVKPKTLTPTQMSILMVILSNVNKDSKEAFPTQENIRKRVGIASDTTYYKAFKPLLEQGWIIQRKRFNASACYQVVIPDDIYALLTNTVSTENVDTTPFTVSTESVESVSTESVESVSTESVELTTNITTNNNNKYIHSYANASEDKDSFSNEKRTTNNGVAIAPPSNANAKNQSNQNKVDNNIMMKEIYKTLLSQLNLKHDKKYANTVAKKLRENSEALEQIHKETMEFNYDRIINKYKDEYERLNKVLYTIINEANQQYKQQKEKESFYGELPDELQDYYDTFFD